MTASLKPVDSCNVMYYQLNAGVGDSMNFNPITTNHNIYTYRNTGFGNKDSIGDYEK